MELSKIFEQVSVDVEDLIKEIAEAHYAHGSFIPPKLAVCLLLVSMYLLFKLVKFLYGVLCEPINRVKPLSSVGYVPFDGDNHESQVRRVRENRIAGDLPPLYPNGWYPLAESFELKTGESKPFWFCGQNVVAFRDAKQVVHILDAYCPHLGAHLGVGGRVVGSCIECPFHGWLFDGASGRCTHIPYAERIPEQAKIRSWAVCETNGWIFVWFDAEERDPFWHLPQVEGIAERQLTYRGRTEHFMNGHIEEVPLNGADLVHLKIVHKAFAGDGVDLRTMRDGKLGFIEHSFDASWSPSDNPDEKHISLVKLDHSFTIFGYAVPAAKYNISIRQIGPAFVTLEFKSLFGRIVFLHCLLPVEPLVQRIVHNVYASWAVPTWLAKTTLVIEAMQIERDLMIWNNKQYQSKPLFVRSAEDSLLIKHRRWYSQFYSENSPRLIVQPRVRYGRAKGAASDATCNASSKQNSQNPNDHEELQKNVDW